MMKKITFKLLLIGVTVSTLISTVPSYASSNMTLESNSQYLNQTISYNDNQNGWYKYPDGSWGYFVDHNQLVKDTLLRKADGDYLIGTDGKMVTGWAKSGKDHKWYFFGSDGKANKGWLQSDGLWYYFDNTGAMLTDWQKLDGRWYYFDTKTGVMACNIKVGDYFLSSDGSLQ